MTKVLKFFGEVKAEFKNITWPKRDALIQLTIVVISLSALTAAVLGSFDFIFTNSLGYLTQVNKPTPVSNQKIQITIAPQTPTASASTTKKP